MGCKQLSLSLEPEETEAFANAAAQHLPPAFMATALLSSDALARRAEKHSSFSTTRLFIFMEEMSRVPSEQPAIQTECCALGFSGEPLSTHSTLSRVFAFSNAHFSPPPPPLTPHPTCRLSPLCSSLLPALSSDKLGCNSLGFP